VGHKVSNLPRFAEWPKTPTCYTVGPMPLHAPPRAGLGVWMWVDLDKVVRVDGVWRGYRDGKHVVTFGEGYKGMENE